MNHANRLLVQAPRNQQRPPAAERNEPMQMRSNKTLKETIDDLQDEVKRLKIENAVLKKAATPAPESVSGDSDVIRQYMAIKHPIARAKFAREHNLVSPKE